MALRRVVDLARYILWYDRATPNRVVFFTETQGHDTTATLISFSIFELAKHEDVQAKIMEEIEFVVGNGDETEVTLNHLAEMNYLDRVVKELLRLYPPVPLFERELTEDVVLGKSLFCQTATFERAKHCADGIFIPRGTTITFHPFFQHRHEDLFPDPEKFDPDRFLPENVLKRDNFAYIPFSAGPRNCIGESKCKSLKEPNVGKRNHLEITGRLLQVRSSR